MGREKFRADAFAGVNRQNKYAALKPMVTCCELDENTGRLDRSNRSSGRSRTLGTVLTLSVAVALLSRWMGAPTMPNADPVRAEARSTR